METSSDCFMSELYDIITANIRKNIEEQNPLPQKVWTLLLTNKYDQGHTYDFMITITTENFNTISQKSYDEIINSLEFHNLYCSCGHCACLIRHGSYERTIKEASCAFRLCVLRVRCKNCKQTHALLIASIVPYSQIILKVQATIIDCYERKTGFREILEANLSIDENNISAIVLRFRRHWKQRLLSQNIQLCPLGQLIQKSFSAFGRQFMQIKSTRNILFLRPT